MLIKAKCRKCGQEGAFDIGGMTKEEAEEKLKKIKSFNCSFGNHMEIMSPLQFMDFDWDNPIEGKALSEEDFLRDLKLQYDEVYTTEELTDKYCVSSFLYGRCLVYSKANEDDLKLFDFVESPKGKRYYIYIEQGGYD